MGFHLGEESTGTCNLLFSPDGADEIIVGARRLAAPPEIIYYNQEKIYQRLCGRNKESFFPGMSDPTACWILQGHGQMAARF